MAYLNDRRPGSNELNALQDRFRTAAMPPDSSRGTSASRTNAAGVNSLPTGQGRQDEADKSGAARVESRKDQEEGPVNHAVNTAASDTPDSVGAGQARYNSGSVLNAPEHFFISGAPLREFKENLHQLQTIFDGAAAAAFLSLRAELSRRRRLSIPQILNLLDGVCSTTSLSHGENLTIRGAVADACEDASPEVGGVLRSRLQGAGALPAQKISGTARSAEIRRDFTPESSWGEMSDSLLGVLKRFAELTDLEPFDRLTLRRLIGGVQVLHAASSSEDRLRRSEQIISACSELVGYMQDLPSTQVSPKARRDLILGMFQFGCEVSRRTVMECRIDRERLAKAVSDEELLRGVQLIENQVDTRILDELALRAGAPVCRAVGLFQRCRRLALSQLD
ncbi:MAG: hypothetical protein EBZ48_08035 [Proteobacteria bacterium]|nr:hypothetical protein [Pseudomonadota bacterium]